MKSGPESGSLNTASPVSPTNVQSHVAGSFKVLPRVSSPALKTLQTALCHKTRLEKANETARALVFKPCVTKRKSKPAAIAAYQLSNYLTFLTMRRPMSLHLVALTKQKKNWQHAHTNEQTPQRARASPNHTSISHPQPVLIRGEEWCLIGRACCVVLMFVREATGGWHCFFFFLLFLLFFFWAVLLC